MSANANPIAHPKARKSNSTAELRIAEQWNRFLQETINDFCAACLERYRLSLELEEETCVHCYFPESIMSLHVLTNVIC